jgi:hypothetical protein
MTSSSQFKAGEWVEVRSKEEILATLGADAELEGLPFMPEMFQFCGKRFQVFKRAHKTCDPPNGLQGRRMPRAVHLDGVRCDGAAHAGCQAACLIFWKDAWLKRADGPATNGAGKAGACTERDVWNAAQGPGTPATPDEATYACQSTRVAAATQPLRWWDVRQYLEDWESGNVRPLDLLDALAGFVSKEIATAGLGLGSAVRWAYNRVQRFRGGTPYPWGSGEVPRGVRTPSRKLDLQPGELVRVRSHQEILETLDENLNNRGMCWDPEMVPYCGGTYRVLRRVNTIIDEKTGRVQRMKNECIQLEDVVCRACYAKYRRFCPRSIFPYWREIWLERVGSSDPAGSS